MTNPPTPTATRASPATSYAPHAGVSRFRPVPARRPAVPPGPPRETAATTRSATQVPVPALGCVARQAANRLRAGASRPARDQARACQPERLARLARARPETGSLAARRLARRRGPGRPPFPRSG